MWPPQSCPGHTDGRAGLPSPWQSPWQSGRCRWATHCSTTIWDRSKLSQFPGFVYNLKETNPILTLCPLYPACWRQDWHTSGLYPAHSNDSINKSEGKYQWENVSVNIFHLFLWQHPMVALLNLYSWYSPFHFNIIFLMDEAVEDTKLGLSKSGEDVGGSGGLRSGGGYYFGSILKIIS